MNPSPCRLCGCQEKKFVFDSFNTHGRHIIDKIETFKIVQCQNCTSFYIDNLVVDEAYYAKYYQLGYYQIGVNPKGFIAKTLDAMARRSIRKKEDHIIAHLPKSNHPYKLLDVGCGDGTFLERLNKNRFEGTGVEINPEGYEICNKKGLVVHNSDIKTIDFGDKKFDVITLWNVLEHVDNPRELTAFLLPLLSKNGVLVLQVPNANSLGFKLGKQYWFHLDSPRHLVHFNKTSIKKLCDLTGFELVTVINEYYDYPQDLFWSIRKSSFKYIVYPLYPIFKLFSRELLTCICQKPSN